jgi:hypothetical protein
MGKIHPKTIFNLEHGKAHPPSNGKTHNRNNDDSEAIKAINVSFQGR